MKPIINDIKCGAVEQACKALKICPEKAISYKKVIEPILNKNVSCSSSTCDCDCGDSECVADPYGRIIIDYDKCIECGLCADECCGLAIEMK